MKIHEYEARRFFESAGISVPKAFVATNEREVAEAASKLSFPVVLKAQVLVAGRGKAGGIKFAKNPREAKQMASLLFGSAIKEIRVQKILVAERLEAAKELYVGITVDRDRKAPVLIATSEGGVDLEELAETKPSLIVKCYIDPVVGLKPYQARAASKTIALRKNLVSAFGSVCSKMYDIFKNYDAELVERNPLAISRTGDFVALDTRMIIDDNALYRHPEVRKSEEELTTLEREASEHGLAYVQLDGEVGIMGNGAGLVMATLDIVEHFGGRPANFLDVGGGARADVIQEGTKIVTKNPKVRVVFVNILGGITRCEEVAAGIVSSIRDLGTSVPFVVRLVGTNEEEGKKILDASGITYFDSMEEGAKQAVFLSGSRR